MTEHFETVIIGAGAAGLHCAAFAKAGGRTLLIDHAKKPGEKIRISGGGRCNFTNIFAAPDNFISANRHFAKSAMARYTQWDFIELVQRHGIAYHEKTLGQQFCDDTAKDIIQMLLDEAKPSKLWLDTSVTEIRKSAQGFDLTLSGQRKVTCRNLVIASGGKSIPKMGATGFGYQIAKQFGHAITPTRAGLVPLTFADADLELFKSLAGVALPVAVTCNGTSFKEAMLFTHRGLSGPAILQISSYWRESMPISINLLPDTDLHAQLIQKRRENGRRNMSTVLADFFPARLATSLSDRLNLRGNIADQSDRKLKDYAEALQNWVIKPIGTEGYRTAEVTLGGVDTDGLNSKTMESKTTPGLYFIGEVVDVTGWLGGYNFQWAWSSAHAAGTAIATN